ncbi:MAG: VanZ family protein [Solobacterium sp.]|jgi:glycopeptide antibiotics resistance protein|nr:VanZ family protein [Solobacterium sp.]MCH4049407.1 VanZ family protein [Solobacterium sp.]MCH4075263.1 VanZ family protein [Solobacterium sp.]MCI1313824.1 VanZ family protein [Solobacterium sp.]MCI1346193.1 VanZ family protein [Solobacterium sp.]
MSTYYEAIRAAIQIYPWVALFFSVFYIAWNYHKYGSIRSLRILIVYSFWLYMLCIYCLVIMPLPDPEMAAALHGRAMQLVPFHFVQDIIHAYHRIRAIGMPPLYILNSSDFLITLFNLFMTMPFGMYMHIYFNCDFKKTVLLSFLLSLFFELTQLSGLYFIYPGSYRLFDVDDLIVNTAGGMLGYAAAIPFMKILPSREEIDNVSYKRGTSISFFRRLSSFCIDLFCVCMLFFMLEFANSALSLHLHESSLLPAIPLYFIVMPLLMKGSTPGKKVTSIKRVDVSGTKAHWYQLFGHTAIRLLILFFIPWLMLESLTLIKLRQSAILILGGIYAGIYLLILLIGFVHMVTHHQTLSERLSHTKLISTVKHPVSEKK